MVFGEIESALALIDRAKKWIKQEKNQSMETVAGRFIRLFEAHDVHRNQIPKFFGHGLSIAHFKDEDTLHPHLTDKILDDACQLFAVRREWLDGAEDDIYQVHHFHEDVEGFNRYIDELQSAESAWLRAELTLSTNSIWQENALLIFIEEIGYLRDKPINRYHLVSGWVHRYWKCRAELAACIAMLLNKKIHLKGHLVKQSIDRFCSGLEFTNTLSNYRHLKPYEWHPDSWVYDPEDFVKELADEQFGKVNALARWLEYYENGFMNTGYSRADAVNEFTNELAKQKRT